LVRLKLADADTPAALAVTRYAPGAPLAAGVGEVATPLALVTAVAVAPPPNSAEAPLAGAENVTLTPATGLLPESRTVACNAVAKLVLMSAICPAPALAAMDAGDPPALPTIRRFVGGWGATGPLLPPVFVRLKVAGVATPGTLAARV
jgi:hypothetical protein